MMNTGSTIFRPSHWDSRHDPGRWKFTLALDHYEEQHTGFHRPGMKKKFPCLKHSPWRSKGVHDGLRSAFLTSPVVLRCSELFVIKSITLIQIKTHAISTFCWCIDVSWIRFFHMKASKADGVVLMQHQRDSPKGEPFEFSNGMLTLSIHHALSTLRRMSWYLSLDRMLYWISIESQLSHQQLLTNIPSSLPTSSNGFFIEIYKNIIKVAFFIEDDIRALEHENLCNFQSASYDRPFVRVSWNTRMYISIIMCLKVWSNEIELNIRWNICLRAILASNMKVGTM